ncbi:MAG TPA: hypothetical protein VFH47_02580 [Candidatus Thermoplasmatota archaeon]|nr:hypothetical protein [Candidatus Thermoplasmatota archaeon]
MVNLVGLLAARMRMLVEDAQAVAHVVEDAFKGQSELDDAEVPKELRQVFYDLQDERILEVRRDEARGDAGTERHYYWRLREDPVRLPEPNPAPDPVEKLYARLGDSAWERRRPELS